MKYIISNPIITNDSIKVRVELESDPSWYIEVTETGVSKNEFEEKLTYCLQVIARKIANHTLGYI